MKRLKSKTTADRSTIGECLPGEVVTFSVAVNPRGAEELSAKTWYQPGHHFLIGSFIAGVALVHPWDDSFVDRSGVRGGFGEPFIVSLLAPIGKVIVRKDGVVASSDDGRGRGVDEADPMRRAT